MYTCACINFIISRLLSVMFSFNVLVYRILGYEIPRHHEKQTEKRRCYSLREVLSYVNTSYILNCTEFVDENTHMAPDYEYFISMYPRCTYETRSEKRIRIIFVTRIRVYTICFD